MYIFSVFSVLIRISGGGMKYIQAVNFRERLYPVVLFSRPLRRFWDKIQAALVTNKRKNGINRPRIAAVSPCTEWGMKYL